MGANANVFNPQFDFRGKRVVVVGASSGMGLAISRACAALGAHVIMASRSPENLDRARRSIDGEVEAFPVNMLDEASVGQLFARVGTLDHVVVTAVADEVKMRASFVDMSTDIAQRSMEKFWGSFYVARAAAPRIPAGGSITLTSSVAIFSPPANGGYAVMNAASSAVASLGRSLAAELKPVRVNVVTPGTVNTGVWSHMTAAQAEEFRQSARERLPVQHLAEPEEMAQAYLYLMSNSNTTGTILVSDGGSLLT